jgi:hypothetical protein
MLLNVLFVILCDATINGLAQLCQTGRRNWLGKTGELENETEQNDASSVSTSYSDVVWIHITTD